MAELQEVSGDVLQRLRDEGRLPRGRLLSGRGDLLDGVMALARLGTLAGTRRAYDNPSRAYWLSPLADVPVALRLTQSTLRPERTWRGRTYPT